MFSTALLPKTLVFTQEDLLGLLQVGLDWSLMLLVGMLFTLLRERFMQQWMNNQVKHDSTAMLVAQGAGNRTVRSAKIVTGECQHIIL